MTEKGEERGSSIATTADELGLLISAVGDYAIFILSPDGIIRSWNPGAEHTFGYQAEETVGKSFAMFYPPVDIEAGKPRHELEVAASEGRIEDEGWRIRKGGQPFWVNTVITSIRDGDGVLRGFAKVTRDLTTRRAAEERLRQSEEMFRLLVSAVQDYAIFMLDTTGHIVTWNAGAERIKGYKPEEIIGKHFSIFYPEADKEAHKPEHELEIASRTGVYEEEGWRLRKDGSRFWANVLITAVHDEHGRLRGFAKITRDITERKKAEETQRALMEQQRARMQAEEERRRAEQSYRVAQEANRAKDEFLMTLSHELRTPMTAILGWARLLPTMSPEDTNFHEAINQIARGAQLQAHLIDDVLDVSRIVSGKLRLSREKLDLARVISNAVEAVRPTADAKSITVTAALEPGLGTIVADPTRIQQVLWNLLSNAMKFTPKHGRVEVSARRSESQVHLVVTDTGEGIDPDFLPHVFEAFRQAENPNTRIHGGLGLGLSIVRYIAEAHGGTVTAESAGRGKGATFIVTLPIAAVAPAVTGSPSSIGVGPVVDPERLRGANIVIVDDDRGGREMVRTVLTQAGADVTSFDSAPPALAALETMRPDLIVTDLAMPVMDGYTFVRELRRRPEAADVKIIALTAFPTPAAAEQSGFDAFLAKPIDPFKLVDEVARVILTTSSRTARRSS
ncbi:MAG TPA: PAS domain S-box protein [Thermoanaerobaculia bacterium]|nr:PAS domain S-box protein [Thermoanaerobaculia bacterium]